VEGKNTEKNIVNTFWCGGLKDMLYTVIIPVLWWWWWNLEAKCL